MLFQYKIISLEGENLVWFASMISSAAGCKKVTSRCLESVADIILELVIICGGEGWRTRFSLVSRIFSTLFWRGGGIMALYLALSQNPAPRLGGHFLCGHLSEQMPWFLCPFLLAFVDIVLLSICRPNRNCFPQINSSVG